MAKANHNQSKYILFDSSFIESHSVRICSSVSALSRCSSSSAVGCADSVVSRAKVTAFRSITAGIRNDILTVQLSFFVGVCFVVAAFVAVFVVIMAMSFELAMSMRLRRNVKCGY